MCAARFAHINVLRHELEDVIRVCYRAHMAGASQDV
jgi:hypothetical protein